MKDRVIQIIEECSPYVELPELTLETKIIDDLGYDSLCIIELFEEIEEEFGVDCMNYADVYQALQTVGDLIEFIQEKKA